MKKYDASPARDSGVLEARFRQIVDAVPDGLIIVDASGAITLVNRQTETMFGYTRQELTGTPIEVLVPERLRGAHPGHRKEYVAHPRVRPMGVGMRLFARRKDGTEFPCEISLSPVETAEGLQTVATVRDVTWRVQAEDRERQLSQERAARAAAEQAVRVRDEFLSVASHELRTPLTAMLMRLQILIRQAESGKLPHEVAQALEAPLKSAQRLTALIDQLLDVTRISTGRLVLERRVSDVAAIVRGVVGQFAGAQPGVSIEFEAPESLEFDVDPGRFEQVATNLLSNAMKYGEGKPVTVALRSADGRLELAVRDRGIGIAPAHQKRIFDRFERAVTEANYAGLGLGLFISRQIVEAHGGAILVESRPGEGAVFTVRIPR